MENRYCPKWLIVDVHVGIGSRGSSVEACLAPIGEKVRSQAANQLVRCGGERCYNLFLCNQLRIWAQVRGEPLRAARQQCGEHEWGEPTRCSHIYSHDGNPHENGRGRFTLSPPPAGSLYRPPLRPVKSLRTGPAELAKC